MSDTSREELWLARRREAYVNVGVSNQREGLGGAAVVGVVRVHVDVQKDDVGVAVSLIVSKEKQAVRCVGVPAKGMKVALS